MTRWRVCALVAGLAAGLAIVTDAGATNVLLLGDGGGDTQVQQALQNAGHTVTNAGLYYNWDGVTPGTAGFNLIVALDGTNYGSDFTAGAKAALSAFVAGRGSVLFTEWTAWDVEQGNKTQDPTGNLLPTVSPAGAYGYGDTWTVVNPSDPLVAGVPASWSDAAGWSTVTAKPGAVVLITGTSGNPLFSYWTAPGGRVFHLNHDMTYSTSTINANALQLIVDVAGTSAPNPIPALGRVGLAAMAGLLGLAALLLLKRR